MKILLQNKGGYLETQEVRATRDRENPQTLLSQSRNPKTYATPETSQLTEPYLDGTSRKRRFPVQACSLCRLKTPGFTVLQST